jgi:dipeptidase E
VKLLLTSSGITNASIRAALEELVGKPLSSAAAVCVPTAIYAMPGGGSYCWHELRDLGELGWREFGLLELTTLPTILEEHWLPTLKAADVLLVGGGNTPYLSYWMYRSGLAEKLPDLPRDLVYVGVSAGSMVASHSLRVNPDVLASSGIYDDDLYDDVAPPQAGSDRALRLVEFVVRPHLNSAHFAKVTVDRLAGEATAIDVPLYAIDDQTAIKVVDGRVEVVSEGEWRLFGGRSSASIPTG